jgi:hypothetical protein
MATRLLPPGYQQLDANGAPVSGAKLYTYSAGTTTPKATYSDAGLTILNSNPVEADAAGRFGDIFATTGSYALVMETSAGAPIWDADPVDGATGSTAAPGAGIRNLLTDGDFASVLTLTAVATDGGYIADNWYALNQSNNTTASLQTLQQDGIPNNLRITQANATPQRYGVAQVIPAADSYRARGSSVTLSGKIRHSLAAPIRYAVLAWTGTADAPTKDVVNDWTSASYTAGGFFNSTTLTVVGVGSITPTANTWTDITALSGSVTSSANNLIVFVWTEGATVQNATLDVSQLQLEVAASATAYEFLPDWLASRVTGWRLIADIAVTDVASIDVTWTEGAYRVVEVFLTSIRPKSIAGSTSQNIYARVRIGSSFVSGATDYDSQSLTQEGSTVGGIALTGSAWWLSRGGFAAANDEYSGRFWFDPGGGSSGSGIEPGFHGQERHSSHSGPARRQGMISGSYGPGGTISGLRFLWEDGGNFSPQGRITVLGLRA